MTVNNIMLAPGDGIGFPWHQDSMHRREGHGDFAQVNAPHESYCNILVAIDPAACPRERRGPPSYSVSAPGPISAMIKSRAPASVRSCALGLWITTGLRI